MKKEKKHFNISRKDAILSISAIVAILAVTTLFVVYILGFSVEDAGESEVREPVGQEIPLPGRPAQGDTGLTEKVNKGESASLGTEISDASNAVAASESEPGDFGASEVNAVNAVNTVDSSEEIELKENETGEDGSGEAAANGNTAVTAAGDAPLICIDPGHYIDSSVLEGEELYGYGEGRFVLKLALALKGELEKYGFRVIMTRNTDHISLGGYTDGDLDSSHIALRGEAAAGCDLFISLHTNANDEDANGYPTCSQPLEINKTVLIVNNVGSGDVRTLNVANELGTALSAFNHEAGLATQGAFQRVGADTLRLWDMDYNDGLGHVGTVCYRKKKNGEDYYGVLRGASNVGTPGLIIEHGYHTVKEVRKQAMQGSLAGDWARTDAYAIAKGFGML